MNSHFWGINTNAFKVSQVKKTIPQNQYELSIQIAVLRISSCLLIYSQLHLYPEKWKAKTLQQLIDAIDRKEMEMLHTLVTIKGWLKSIPPESLNPQGAGPWRTTFCGIVELLLLVTVLSFPRVCVSRWAVGGRVLAVEHLPDRAADLIHLLGSFTHPTAAGTALYPYSWGDVSQSLGFSTHRGEYQTLTNKAWMLESLQQIPQLYLLLQRPLSLAISKLQDAESFWFLKATLLLISYHAD